MARLENNEVKNRRTPASQQRNYSHPLSPPNRRLKRRGEAEARQKEYDKLTSAEKLTKAKAAPGESRRQIERLS